MKREFVVNCYKLFFLYLKEKVEAHEKQNKYKLCSISPAILLLAFKGLFTEPEYKMPVQKVQNVYVAACRNLEIQMVSSTASKVVTEEVVKVAGGASKASIATKIGITIVVLGIAGGIGFSIINHMNNGSAEEPVSVIEQTAAVSENAESEEDTEKLYDESISLEGLYTYGDYTISITNATVTDDRSAIFDVEIINNAFEDGTVEKLVVKQVSEIDRLVQINGTSDNGSEWMGNLFFMGDGSIIMNMDKKVDGEVWGLSDGMGLMIFTKAATEGLIKDIAPTEGTYTYTEGSDIYQDGGCVVTISDVSTDAGTQFAMQLEIVSREAKKSDIFKPDTDYVYMQNGLGTFYGETGWGVVMNGYIYVNDDGSITLSYTNRSSADEVPWYGAYPNETRDAIILKK